MVTRVPILDVRPQVEAGAFPAKAVQGEDLTVRARVFGEGPNVVRAAVVLTDPEGRTRHPVPMRHLGNDHWAAVVVPDGVGDWTFHVQSWHDPVATWVRVATRRFEADVDLEMTLAEGAQVLRRAGEADPAAAAVAPQLEEADVPPLDRFALALAFAETLPTEAVQDHLDSSPPLPLQVDRERALVGSWYELFPRSEGAEVLPDGSVRPGTLRTAQKRLEGVAAMGFDVVYLPPVTPIGRTGRKGRDNALVAAPDDPGSPWAIGSADGGHDAVEPALGTVEDFEAFVARATELGLEVALDLALQCSPDHPWVSEHPDWFIHRPDGSIAHAENPPKKYEDIYPLDFDADPGGLYVEVLRIIRTWMERGVRIFRVDNPHTKPVAFWQQLLADVRAEDPDVIFLAEAFTSPAMLHALSAIGFHQSYTYFTWRQGAAETADYLDELSNRTSDFLRPNLFVNTPDILPRYLQDGDESMFRMRAVLAATGSPTWGMYAGYELMEHQAAGPDTEEYLHSEKYQVTVRDWPTEGPIIDLVTRLNELRRRHTALQRLRNLVVHPTDAGGVIAYSKVTGDDIVLVVVDLFPSWERHVAVRVAPADVGLASPSGLLRDELDGTTHELGSITLSPDSPARILVPADR
ncbi:maltotransferase domain-containing protein [Aeromicrobium sp. CF4.19]|uniref:alpha-1,4-glucan--maltose-1-phosphate maltosyltransferase n=1 Tax=Aeromicrobium sp. CF4.19 TaxID=3373082 RepID=UPI003EE653DB